MAGSLLDPGALAVFTALLVGAAAADLRHRRIPNAVSIALVAVLLVWRLAAGDVSGLPASLAVGVGMLAVGFGLHAARVWGGGDAKLLAAVAAWVGLDALARLLLVTTVTGGLIALVALALRRRDPDVSLPYGVAIAVGGIDWMLSRIW